MRKYLKSSSDLYKSFIKYNLICQSNEVSSCNSIIILSIWNDYILELEELHIYTQSLLSYMRSNRYLIDSFSINYNKLKASHLKILNINHNDIEKYFFDYYLMIILPLTVYSMTINHESSPSIIGIQAPQGCGKTTLCNILSDSILLNSNNPCLSLSTDDFYYNYNTLKHLKENSYNHIFKYRGPPGTHEVSLLNNVISNIKSGVEFEYPVFCKKSNNGYGDRLSNIPCIGNYYKYLLLEGWFNGIDSVKIDELIAETRREYSINSNQTEYERVLDVRKYINDIIQSQYEKIWRLFDGFIIIKPERYELSKKWRIETEKSNSGMSNDDITKFIDYFWETVPPYVYFQNLHSNAKKRRGLFKRIDPVILNCDEKREFYI